MIPNSSEYRSWDDLVFEKRNKSYGAYVLRKSYSDNVLTGMFGSIAFFMLLFFLSTLPGGKARITEVLKPLKGEYNPLPPPALPSRPKPVQQQPVRQTRTVNRTLPPRVVQEPVEDKPIVNDAPVTPATSATGTGEQVDTNLGIDQGTGTTTVAPPIEKVIDFAEVMPAYEGGIAAMMKFIRKNLKYPKSAERIGMEGTVYVQFIVNGNGTVSNVVVLRGFHPDCDKEAARVISKLPGWNGGKQNGNPVGVRMVLPITFKVN